jgi:hypothetical protein
MRDKNNILKMICLKKLILLTKNKYEIRSTKYEMDASYFVFRTSHFVLTFDKS